MRFDIIFPLPMRRGGGKLPNKDGESFLLLYEMQMMRTCAIYSSGA